MLTKMLFLLLSFSSFISLPLYAIEDFQPPKPLEKPTVTYECDHGVSFTVEFSASEILLVLAGDGIILTKMPVIDSGVKYSDGTMTFIVNAEKARVEESNAILFSNCKALAS